VPSLAESIAANVRQQGPRCTVALVLPKLSKAQRADLTACFADDTIPATAIAAGLNEHGHKLSPSSVQRHRRGRCGCAR
jgi:hypothetical protein